MERGEKPIHTLCFVLKFSPNEFISSDAMSKLRQVCQKIFLVEMLGVVKHKCQMSHPRYFCTLLNQDHMHWNSVLV